MEKQQQNKTQQKAVDEHDDIDLDKALDNFDTNELNLTDQQPKFDLDEDNEMAQKIKQQYDQFMKQMNNLGAGSNDDDGLENLTSMLGGLLKNLSNETGLEGNQAEISKGFEQMFKNLKQDNIQEAAGKLLNQFMDKSLLYEPLVQAKGNYDEYFKKVKQGDEKPSKEDEDRYNQQYKCLTEIIQTFQKQPESKESKQKLITLFQKMQEYGTPPGGIASPTGLV